MTTTMPIETCTVRRLPADQELEAAAEAIAENAANRIEETRPDPVRSISGLLMETPDAAEPPLTPGRLALLTSRRWAASGVNLTVGFLQRTSLKLVARIMGAANRWGLHGNIKFIQAETASAADIRITFTEGGYWSYLGTDIRRVARGAATMCYQGFNDSTSDAEIIRVVTHEFGHTLGLVHEHLTREIVEKIDRELAIEEFMRTQGWTREDVIYQVLTAYDDALLLRSPSDVLSIMCYFLPARIMKDRIAVLGGQDFSPLDIQTVGQFYPLAIIPPPPPPPPPPPVGMWTFTATGTGDKPVITWK